jgi:hypothetical protein
VQNNPVVLDLTFEDKLILPAKNRVNRIPMEDRVGNQFGPANGVGLTGEPMVQINRVHRKPSTDSQFGTTKNPVKSVD